MPKATDSEQLASLLSAFDGRLTELVSLMRGTIANATLFSGTVLLDANGVWTNSWEVPFGSVMVANGGTSTLTVDASSTKSGPPASGIGTHVCAAAKTGHWRLTGRELTLYGTPGSTVTLVVTTDAPDHLLGAPVGSSSGSFDQAGTEQRVSIYGTNAVAGDKAVSTDANGRLNINHAAATIAVPVDQQDVYRPTTTAAVAAQNVAASGTFNSASADLLNESRITGILNTTQVGTLNVQHSEDNATWYTGRTAAIAAAGPVVIDDRVLLRYVRVQFINGSAVSASTVDILTHTTPVG